MAKISCIVPAYNEGPRLGNVLSIVHNHPLISEVLVIDDCSKDDTSEVARKFSGVRLIRHEVNKGKSQAVVTGIKESTGDYLFFLDADLIGLTPEAISQLIEPVASGKADIAISLRINSPWIWRLIGIDYISGERVFPKKLLENHLEEILRLPRFGLESFMNKLIIAKKYRVKIVFWKNVTSPYKYKKEGLIKGMKSDFFMIVDILKTVSLFGIVRQIYKLSMLKVK